MTTSGAGRTVVGQRTGQSVRASSPIDPGQEVIVNERRASELVARERTRIEALLAEQASAICADGPLQRQQTGEHAEAAATLDSESVSIALAADLREQLAAVGRAEGRIAQGTYGRSIESGSPIPDDRLEADPLAERTVAEQRDREAHGIRR